MIVTLPRTDSSMMKLRPVISEMNLARTGMSTFWKFIVIVFWGGSPADSAAKAEDRKTERAEQQCCGQRPKQKTAHASILRISCQSDVSIFHDPARCATRILANVTVLGDYDDHRPDLIQSKPEKAARTSVRGWPNPGKTRNLRCEIATIANGDGLRYEFLIGLRYLRARRRERFVSVIAIISLAGIAIGTFALTVALSVMSGFEKDLRERLLAFTPQVTIERTDGGVWNPADLEKKIAAMPGVVASAPYVTSQVMAVSSTDSGAPGLVSGGILRGVQPHDNPVLKELKDTLENGTLARPRDDASGDDRR